jgi:exosortase E/protease (VPEID-CTERM system)
LELAYPDVVADPARRILGTSGFRVEIARSCSGYEGIGLIVAFVAVYLWLFRAHLRFPQALLLLPASAIIIWLFNALRIAALIAIGDSWSPEIAAGGFHSQAGWISFLAVALLVVGVTHRSGLFATEQHAAHAPPSRHALLAAALVNPMVVLLAASIVTAAVSTGFDAWYPLKVAAAAGALWYFRSRYRQLGWSWSWPSVAIGVAVFVMWILLEPEAATPPTLPGDLAAMPAWLAGLWLAFRVVGSVAIVPLVEELAFRGYLLRKLAASRFEDVDPRHFSLFAFVASDEAASVHGAILSSDRGLTAG